MRAIRSGGFAVLALGVLGSTQAQVRGSLIAADNAAQPGKPLTVALKIVHEPRWHTYWVNPGIGQATTIEWTLPVGWSAGDIDWPVPHLFLGPAGNVTGHGFDGTAYLPVTLTVPESAHAGESVTLRAKAKWLMCSPETCVPGGSTIELKIPIDAAATHNAEVYGELAKVAMPKRPDAPAVRASARGRLITLKIAGAGDLKTPHFFPRTELVSYDAEQKYTATGKELILTLPIDKSYAGNVKTLEGVLSYTDASGQYAGMIINTPLVR